MGGKLVTLASDAHVPKNVGNAFRETAAVLQNMGFDGYCIFNKRILSVRGFR
jgi:histidinol phosphatase-like PHP family hydrolase